MTYDQPEPAAAEITCREVAAWASAYIDQHLDDAAKVRMALHLAACAGCDAYVRHIAAVRDLLPLLPGVGAQPAQRDRLRQAFAARQNRPPTET
jgi:anti-sigma factor RsiW